LLDGLFTRTVPLKGFRVVDYISSSSPKLAWRKGRVLSVNAIDTKVRRSADQMRAIDELAGKLTVGPFVVLWRQESRSRPVS
ncbi:MAG: hypothetical protein ACKVT0_06230, partial [Planctomycetaceae bacterium]